MEPARATDQVVRLPLQLHLALTAVRENTEGHGIARHSRCWLVAVRPARSQSHVRTGRKDRTRTCSS